MGWLARRALVVWLILIALCAVVVGIVRTNGGQDRLQALGFGICEGGPCFRGIKVGMQWSDALRLGQDAIQTGPPIVFDLSHIDDGLEMFVQVSDEGTTVKLIGLTAYSPSAESRLSAADLVQHFGSPCGVHVIRDDAGIREIFLIYPQIQARIYTEAEGLALNSRFRSIEIWDKSSQSNFCTTENDAFNGPWRGFTSVVVYLARNRRALGMTR